MNDFYYRMLDTMEKAGVDRQYMDGWACGYLRNPRRGPQYLTDAYEAGYEDGMGEKQDGFSSWLHGT